MKNKLRPQDIMMQIAVIIIVVLSLTGCDDPITFKLPCRHIWTDGIIIETPDCETTGLQQQICTECNVIGRPRVLAYKHNPNENTGFCEDCDALGYYLGDTGPGGGIIFFISEVGFLFYQGVGTGSTGTVGGTSVTAHFLEAAPEDLPELLAWSTRPFIEYNANNFPTVVEANSGDGRANWPLGSGLRATLRIVAFDDGEEVFPAALACYEYENNGKSDWFLPNRTELERLYYFKTFQGNFGIQTFHNYWASTAIGTQNAWDFDFTFGDNNGRNPDNEYAVRPIRAF